MEDFGDSEATVAVVIFRQQNGTLNWRATQDSNASEVIGMLTCAREALLHDWVKGLSGGDGKT
jgi:hypothetical protein